MRPRPTRPSVLPASTKPGLACRAGSGPRAPPRRPAECAAPRRASAPAPAPRCDARRRTAVGVADGDAALDHAGEVDQAGARAGEPEHPQVAAAARRATAGTACARASPGRCRSGASARAASSSSANGSAKNRTSARACSGDQSALARATRCQSSRTAMRIIAMHPPCRGSLRIRNSRTRRIAHVAQRHAFPRRQHLDVRRAREVVRDVGGMHEVVAGHQQHRNRAARARTRATR